ncbi:hypothetical protein GQR58_030709 [Nymphon striatum]|nr:hypothetical protein GQR58_030709 [Nymphon striatum]
MQEKADGVPREINSEANEVKTRYSAARSLAMVLPNDLTGHFTKSVLKVACRLKNMIQVRMDACAIVKHSRKKYEQYLEQPKGIKNMSHIIGRRGSITHIISNIALPPSKLLLGKSLMDFCPKIKRAG